MLPKWFSKENRLTFFAIILSWIISFSLYAYTAAPHVTLLDSGELILAAQHFGVPHPSGYPLWTIGAWLWQNLLFSLPGSIAWKINLFSGFCGASAVTTSTWIIVASIRWFSPNWLRRHFFETAESNTNHIFLGEIIGITVGISSSLLWAVSVPMWSQCVIAEVYSLHAWIVMLWTAMLLKWAQEPQENRWLILSYFFYALGLSNHHLILTLAPIPILLAALIRPQLFPELLIYLSLTAASLLSLFSWLSDDPKTPLIDYPFLWPTTFRFLGTILICLIIWLTIKRKLEYWKLGLKIAFVWMLGLLPYFYMPISSSTNPPMDWGFTHTQGGFFYSINRSQYHGNLTHQIDRTLGHLMGTADPTSNSQPSSSGWPEEVSRFERFLLFCGLYWGKIRESFTLLSIFFFLCNFISIFWLARHQRAWIFTILTAFMLAAFLEPFFGQPTIDLAGWLYQMPYHTYSFGLFALTSAFGFAWYSMQLFTRFFHASKTINSSSSSLQSASSQKRASRFSLVTLLTILVSLSLVASAWMQNFTICSQRGHDFGWIFGHEMLKNLPQKSVLFGGTDPGRFVPTYLILGESSSTSKDSRTNGWDRRDLYILTQNALGDRFYIDVTRRQYGENRDRSIENNFLMQWVGHSVGSLFHREKIYPETPLKLPTDEELGFLIQSLHLQNLPIDQDTNIIQSAIAEWIFLNNKDKHSFFVEESFPMLWSYPFAQPHGFCYEICPEPIQKLSPEIIQQDRSFWLYWTQWLLTHPYFKKDIDAQRSFSKLRLTTARIYHFRKMYPEAEEALLQSLALSPTNAEALSLFSSILTEQNRFDELFNRIQTALKIDPYQSALHEIFATAQKRKELAEREQSLEKALQNNPIDLSAIMGLIELKGSFRKWEEADLLANQLIQAHPKNPDSYRNTISYYLQISKPEPALKIAEKWNQALPNDIEAKRMLTRLYCLSGQFENAKHAAEKCIQQGGLAEKLFIATDPSLEDARQKQIFKDILN